MLLFRDSDGLGLSANNSVTNLTINAPAHQKAIYTTVAKEDLGTFHLENLTLQGQLSLIIRLGV